MRANNIFSPCTTMEIRDKSIMAKIKTKLDKENDHGFIEYKLKLTGIEEERFNHLVSQMKYRLSEGEGEAIYEIGVTDDGVPQGLVAEEYKETLHTIRRMASKLGADVTVLCEKVVSQDPIKTCAELLVRKFVEDCYVDLRVAVAGEQASGKSTLIGVLTSGELDDGYGSARTHVFLHSHEIETGQTSALSHQILAFDSKGNVINYSPYGQQPWQSVIEHSSKICTFIDLAGHKKYMKTTVKGIAGTEPDYVCLVVGANMGVSEMTREHFRLAVALKLCVFVVITKTDIASPARLEKTKEEIEALLKYIPGSRRASTYVTNQDDVMTVAKSLNNKDSLCPIFEVSSVSGKNFNLIRDLINVLPCHRDWSQVKNEPFECAIDRCFNLTELNGLVVSGLVRKGKCFIGDTFQLGPDRDGTFYPVAVQSIHRNHVSTRYAEAGNIISLEIRHVHPTEEIVKETLHQLFKKCRGVHLVEQSQPYAVQEFEARVIILYHQKCFQRDYEPLLHIRNFSQPAKILSIERLARSKISTPLTDTPSVDDAIFDTSFETGDHALVRFKFCLTPVLVKPNDRILFREGNTKGIGTITNIFPSKN